MLAILQHGVSHASTCVVSLRALPTDSNGVANLLPTELDRVVSLPGVYCTFPVEVKVELHRKLIKPQGNARSVSDPYPRIAVERAVLEYCPIKRASDSPNLLEASGEKDRCAAFTTAVNGPRDRESRVMKKRLHPGVEEAGDVCCWDTLYNGGIQGNRAGEDFGNGVAWNEGILEPVLYWLRL